MRTPFAKVACVAASALMISSLAVFAPNAFASSSAGAGRLDPTLLNPIILGPKPVPGSCPQVLTTDPWALNFVTGNGVGYGSTNKNGDWGGLNAEGPGELVLSTGATEYSGHLHFWTGGGQNSPATDPPTNQAEFGVTIDFIGSGIGGNINIHFNGHMTLNNNNVPTASVRNVNVSCS